MSALTRWFLPAIALVLVAPGCDCTPPVPQARCSSNADCREGEVCIDSRCMAETETDGGPMTGMDADTSGPDGAMVDAGPRPDGEVTCPTARTCAGQGIECGPAADGCGGALDCGTCGSGEVCGSGEDRGQCIVPSCDPLGCGDHPGVNCGPVSDGCGGLTESCGGCTEPDICGGGGVANVCGGSGFRMDPDCVGLCMSQVFCGPNPDDATTLTGTVFAPNGTLPLPNAVVYVPNAPLPTIDSGVSCDRCEDEELGSPLVGTVSAFDGTFTLRHVPAGVDFPLVIKIGKWRRVVTIPAIDPCEWRALVPEQTRLPRNQTEGNIPRIAATTGSVDAMECVLFRVGVDASEFTNSMGAGRIHIYRGTRGGGNGNWPPGGDCGAPCRGTFLHADEARMNSYDQLIYSCEANVQGRDTGHQAILLNYLNLGGRAFLSHYHYDWLNNNTQGPPPHLRDTAVWNGNFNNHGSSTDADINDTFGRGMIFRDWLEHVDALQSVAPPRVRISAPRSYVQDVALSTREWIRANQGSPSSTQQMTFNTPLAVAEADQCGRVVYSAFHVTGVGSGGFPNYCASGDLTAQEKALAFMLFDLAGCISGDEPPPPPTCTPRTCESVGAECGMIGDGCGDGLDCGPCPPGTACGAGGMPNICGGDCPPLSCDDHGAECGEVSDGCGATLDCGECPPGETCGFQFPNICGALG